VVAAGHLIGVGAPTMVACWIAVQASKVEGVDHLKIIRELAELIRTLR